MSENDKYYMSQAEMYEDIKGLVKAYRMALDTDDISDEQQQEYQLIIDIIDNQLKKERPSLSTGICDYIDSTSRIRVGAWQGTVYVNDNLSDDEKSEIIDNICKGRLKGNNYFAKIRILLHNPDQRTLFRNLSIPARQKIAEDIVYNNYSYGAFLEVRDVK